MKINKETESRILSLITQSFEHVDEKNVIRFCDVVVDRIDQGR